MNKYTYRICIIIVLCAAVIVPYILTSDSRAQKSIKKTELKIEQEKHYLEWLERNKDLVEVYQNCINEVRNKEANLSQQEANRNLNACRHIIKEK